jgi:hypothetical protein
MHLIQRYIYISIASVGRLECMTLVLPILDKIFYLASRSQRHNNIWGSKGVAPPFLTSALVGCEWSASLPDRFTLWKGTPGIYS